LAQRFLSQREVVLFQNSHQLMTDNFSNLSVVQLQTLISQHKSRLAEKVNQNTSLAAAIQLSEHHIEDIYEIFLPQFPEEKQREKIIAALTSPDAKLEWHYTCPLPIVRAIACGSLPQLQNLDFSGNSFMDDESAIILAYALMAAAGAQQIAVVNAAETSVGARGAAALIEAVVKRGVSGGGPLQVCLNGCASRTDNVVSNLLATIAHLDQQAYSVSL
jgi:hypothetical protein